MSLVVKNQSANAGDMRGAVSVPELGRCPGGGHGNPLQYSCLENPIDRGAWQATVHERACMHTHTHTHTHILMVAIPFSRGSSHSRDQTQVSCTAGGYFTS